MRHARSLSFAVLAAAGLALPVAARPITHVSEPVSCDGGVPLANHELGNPPPGGAFPPDQAIASASTFTEQSACVTSGPPAVRDDPTIANRIVSITNLTGIAWTDLWFVADEGFTMSNVDILIADTTADAALGSPGVFTPAFRIDKTGINTPLVSESLTGNEIFEPGETWTFIVQDWTPVGTDPALMGSIGFAGRSPAVAGAASDSNASIIALASSDVPVPATIGLLASALALLSAARINRRG